jgi:hypothetical protein
MVKYTNLRDFPATFYNLSHTASKDYWKIFIKREVPHGQNQNPLNSPAKFFSEIF